MGSKIYIIAEAGVNHNGSFVLAKKLALVAKEAGADAVKFQTFKAEKLVTKGAAKAEYQVENTGNDDSQYSMLKKLELSYDEFVQLKEYCDEIGIEFLSTPFDLDSLEFLDRLGIKLFKIPSGEITNYPYLVKIAETGKPVILSTGMSTMREVKEAVEVLKEHGTKDISLLHCTTEYPAPVEAINLRAMQTMRNILGLSVGYSDHTEGTEIPVAVVAMGAEIIEKHFTLDKTMEGPDHKASLNPEELKAMVRGIRNVEKALGNGEKKPSVSESKNIAIARKSIVAKTDIKKGEIFTEDNLTVKRPGNGISPMKWENVLGQAAKQDFKEDELICI